MSVSMTKSGLVVVDIGKKEEPKPVKKEMKYFVTHYDDLDEIQRMIKAVEKINGEVVSIVRHGTSNRILKGVGYVIVFYAERFIEVERKT